MSRSARRSFALAWLGLLGLGASAALAQGTDSAGSSVLYDPGVNEVRRVSVGWERRPGPERQVVDQVCLVPDLPTYLEVISTWDEHHYFPVLFDDVETSFKFLREFRPARIVRYPRKVEAPAAEGLWDQAVAAVGRAWTGEGVPKAEVLAGDAVPRRLGPTPPGVVLSSPESPMLAGAVALAAGRFQPLIRWPMAKRPADILSLEESAAASLQVEALIADRIPKYGQLGDDCDFVTLAGAAPYRYNNKEGTASLDDLIGRSSSDLRRWAFTGRLLGDAPVSAYRAMCALFLQPRSALLFNTYQQQERPWIEYSMLAGASRLSKILPVSHRAGQRASLEGWHQAFDPVNHFGLVLINTHGSPTQFNLPGGPGLSSDIPQTGPAIVLMIHSYSASDPNDPQTIAGRWLANGAFIYYGSLNEPYLQSFRNPTLIAALIGESIPLSAVVRQAPSEPFGKPWRLIYLGDPLYRVKPGDLTAPRLIQWKPAESWPGYSEFQKPEAGATDDTLLNWSLKQAIFLFQQGVLRSRNGNLPATLLSLQRNKLSPPLRPVYDALLADTLLQTNRQGELQTWLNRIPDADRSTSVKRQLDTSQMATLYRLIASRDTSRAQALWNDVVHSPAPRELQERVTTLVGGLADSVGRRQEWRERLRAALRDLEKLPSATVIQAELKRIEEKVGATGGAR